MEKYVVIYKKCHDDDSVVSIVDNKIFDTIREARIVMRKRICIDILNEILEVVDINEICELIANINDLNFETSKVITNTRELSNKNIIYISQNNCFLRTFPNVYEYTIDKIIIDNTVNF